MLIKELTKALGNYRLTETESVSPGHDYGRYTTDYNMQMRREDEALQSKERIWQNGSNYMLPQETH